MRLETVPLVLGVLSGLIGLWLVFDAWLEDHTIVSMERRKQARRERDRLGEALVGLGVLAMAAALIGRDTWRYSTMAVILGSVLLLIGTARNASYLRGVLTRQERPNTTVVTGTRRGSTAKTRD